MYTDDNEINVNVLKGWLESGQKVEVIDLRPGEEYQAWHIPGSRSMDAYQALNAGHPGPLADYIPPENTSVVAVCFVGQTSKLATSYLRRRGIQAFSLTGGMQAWSMAWNTAEVPLERSTARVIQVRRTGKGCLSYLIGSAGEAMVIDASVDPQVYLDLAALQSWRITKVIDTHIQADHISRARPLAQKAQAEYLLPRQGRVSFDYREVEDGDTIDFGQANLLAIHTPGHTFESMSFLLDGEALFTGDTLFLDGVGRPDLKADPDETKQRAHVLWNSLQAISSLDPDILILPSHTGRPTPFDRVPLVAPLQAVKSRVPALAYPETEFVDWILAHLPPNPPNYEFIVQLNEAGLLPVTGLDRLEAGANRCAIQTA